MEERQRKHKLPDHLLLSGKYLTRVSPQQTYETDLVRNEASLLLRHLYFITSLIF